VTQSPHLPLGESNQFWRGEVTTTTSLAVAR